MASALSDKTTVGTAAPATLAPKAGFDLNVSNMLPGNSITVTIAGDGAERTDQRPQLHIDIAGLAAVLLGGTTWHSLAVAGLARAEDPASISAVDQLFAVSQAPYAGFYF